MVFQIINAKFIEMDVLFVMEIYYCSDHKYSYGLPL